jgi:ElaB/YqjD/DUF883 family membrane-anchored ribosome-binding protein
MSKKKARRARAAAAEFAHGARERVEDLYEQAEDAFESARDAAEDQLDEASAYLRRQWEDRPLTVAATALGVGIVIGVLIGGRR